MTKQSENIRKRREELGLTQADLAKACGYKSRTAITNIENGTSEMPLSKLRLCAKALNTNMDYLNGDSTDPNRSYTQNTLDEAYFKIRKFTFDTMIAEDSDKINTYWAQLSEEKKKKLLTYAEFLLISTPKMEKPIDEMIAVFLDTD